MQFLKVSFVLFAFFLISTSIQAQDSDADALVMSDADAMIEKVEEKASFRNNAMSNIVYIDIEALGGNVNDLAVVGSEGEIVYKENMMGLPANTIYELDMESYEKGAYTIRVRTFNDVLKHEVTVK